MTKAERLAILYLRLALAPRCRSGEEGLSQLNRVLEQVENELEPSVGDPSTWRASNRIYPVQADRADSSPQHSGVVRYAAFRHEIFIASNGAIEIRRRATQAVEFSKAGDDGRTVSAFAQIFD